jgi:hypothetical protein
MSEEVGLEEGEDVEDDGAAVDTGDDEALCEYQYWAVLRLLGNLGWDY